MKTLVTTLLALLLCACASAQPCTTDSVFLKQEVIKSMGTDSVPCLPQLCGGSDCIRFAIPDQTGEFRVTSVADNVTIRVTVFRGCDSIIFDTCLFVKHDPVVVWVAYFYPTAAWHPNDNIRVCSPSDIRVAFDSTYTLINATYSTVLIATDTLCPVTSAAQPSIPKLPEKWVSIKGGVIGHLPEGTEEAELPYNTICVEVNSRRKVFKTR